MKHETTARSQTFKIKVWGTNACFTRPEMKVERVSYDVMTPSAARGILEAILWKPAILWRVIQIDVLKPIKWETVRRNEVGAIISTDKVMTAISRQKGQLGMYIEEERKQRAGLLLRDVSYTIHAYFELTEKAGHEDSITKFEEMFNRRASKGQCYHRPYLGCREFAASFCLIADKELLPEPLKQTSDLGWMLLDMDFTGETPIPRFFRANLLDGSIRIPRAETVEVCK